MALGNESFTRPWSRLPFFVGSPKHLRHFHYRSAATHLQPDNTELWQSPSTAQNIQQKSHMKMQAGWGLAAAKPQILGSKTATCWVKTHVPNVGKRRFWYFANKRKEENEITNSSIQINPHHHSHHSHHHCFNLQIKISSNRGTKPRAFHLPNERTGHKPSPAERHPVLHRTFTTVRDLAWKPPRFCIESSKCFKRPHVSKPDDVSRQRIREVKTLKTATTQRRKVR